MFLFGFTAMIAVDSASTALPYMAGLGTVAALFGWVHRGETFVNAFYPTVLECSLYVLIRGAWESYAFAWRKLQWDGFLWLSFAVAAFAAGIAMSAHKARRREAGG